MAQYKSSTGPFEGYLGTPPNNSSNQFMIIDGIAHKIHKVIVHRFSVSDYEDPDLHAAAPLYEWQTSEQGKWVFDHSIETPMWHRQTEAATFNTQYIVTAKLKGVDYTFWQLKWGS
jgi:hypothetical protein